MKKYRGAPVLVSLMLMLWHGARAAYPTSSVLLGTGQFQRHGRWVLDQQFMDQMGLPFLLDDLKTLIKHGAGMYPWLGPLLTRLPDVDVSPCGW